jgi:hypothetical protein
MFDIHASAVPQLKQFDSVRRAGSENLDPIQAASDIYQSLYNCDPACVVFYCCTRYPLDILSKELCRYFGDIPVIGCTSAGEITPEGCRKHSISAFALSKQNFAVETVLIENLATFTKRDSEQLVSSMLNRLEQKAVSIAPVEQHCFAMTLLDGLSIREELVIDALNLSLQNIPLVGGSAGDDQHFVDTQVYYNGRFYSNAAAFMLINSNCRFEVFSYHHLTPQQEKLVVTQVTPGQRIVEEFNAEPAALEYCRINNLKLQDLNSQVFAMHPLAVQIGDQLYIRSIQQVNDDLSLTFFCAIDAGVVLTKMESCGLKTHSATIFHDLQEAVGTIDLVIGFDCIHRRAEIDYGQLEDEMSALYRENKVIGFNSYGEQINGLHLNHTFTGVAIGAPLDSEIVENPPYA